MSVKVLGVGSPLVDYTFQVDEAFISSHVSGGKGGTVHIDDCDREKFFCHLPEKSRVRTPGGSAANTIFALAKLGIATAFCGKLAADEDGDFFKAELAGAQISDDKLITVSDGSTGYCITFVTPDAERTMRSNLGVSQTLPASEFQKLSLDGYAWVHFEGYMVENPEFPLFLEHAAKSNCSISFDLASFEIASGYREVLTQLIKKYVRVLFANCEEAAALCGAELSPEKLALRLGELVPIAALKTGAAGSLVSSGGKIYPVSPFCTGKVQDTTGAGDFYSAGFICGMLHGLEPQMCGFCGSVPAGKIICHQGSRIPECEWKDINNILNTEIKKWTAK